MNIVQTYLLNENKKIIDNINQISKHLDDNNIINNKLIQKKIEYINFYMRNINEELTDINNMCVSNLLLDKEYIDNEYNNYVNMERIIQNFQVTHNL